MTKAWIKAAATTLSLLGLSHTVQAHDVIDLTHDLAPRKEVERLRYFPEINAFPALEAGLSGKGVRITVMGERVDTRHPEIRGQIVSQYDAFSLKRGLTRGEGDMPIRPFHTNDGHGTHIAGIIAAKCDDTGIRGVACGSTLDVYDLGLYDSDAAIIEQREFAEIDLTQLFADALNDVTERGESRITTGSFSLESPAIRLRLETPISSQDVEEMRHLGEETDDNVALLRHPVFDSLPEADRDLLISLDHAYGTFASLQPYRREFRSLIEAVAAYQQADGVYLVTESNLRFGLHSSAWSALPSLVHEIDPELWLSVVMVEHRFFNNIEKFKDFNEWPYLSQGPYDTPLNGCGRLAQDYCLVVPSYHVLSSMTTQTAFSDVDLDIVDGRIYQAIDGHSMGAPMVAAALALLEEENVRHNLGLTMRDLVRLLKDNANRQFSGYTPLLHGRGMLDIGAALEAMQNT